MEHYQKLVELRCFSRQELVELLGGESAANSLIYQYQKKGYIQRVRRDLYAVISLETMQPLCSRYQIATKLAPDACVSHHSAFEYHGYANQVFYEVFVTTQSRFREFSYDGVTYRRVAPGGGYSAVEENRVRVTNLERTVIDSIADFDRIGGLEETLRCLVLIPALREGNLLEALAARGSGVLYQKTGYLLSALRGQLGLSDGFFAQCEKHISGSKRYLSDNHAGFVFHKKWNLYGPANILEYIDKGVDEYGAV